MVISQLAQTAWFESKMFGRLVLLFSVLTFLLLAFTAAIGYFLGFGELSLASLLVIALGLSAIINVATYLWSDKLVLWSTHTKLISEQDNPQLFSIVRNVAQRANIPMPRVGIVESQQPNAFATGKGPDKAIVVATTGILKVLTPSELEAVIGHEISHVTHRDVLVASVAAAIAGTISFLGQVIFFNSFFYGAGGGRGRNNNGGAAILLIVAAILIPIGAMLVQLGISRSRESYADAEGARLTGKPQELINALRKISSQSSAKQWNQRNAPAPSTASLWIVNPLKGSSWTELFSTHPSLQKRVANISKVAQEMGIMVY
jgi:heat shock protein HtpX